MESISEPRMILGFQTFREAFRVVKKVWMESNWSLVVDLKLVGAVD